MAGLANHGHEGRYYFSYVLYGRKINSEQFPHTDIAGAVSKRDEFAIR